MSASRAKDRQRLIHSLTIYPPHKKELRLNFGLQANRILSNNYSLGSLPLTWRDVSSMGSGCSWIHEHRVDGGVGMKRSCENAHAAAVRGTVDVAERGSEGGVGHGSVFPCLQVTER